MNDFIIDVTSPVGGVRTTNTKELAEAIAQRIHVDGMPDDFMSYAPGFIRWAIDAAVKAEREACASTADAFYGDDGGHIAELIRSRGAADPTSGEERER